MLSFNVNSLNKITFPYVFQHEILSPDELKSLIEYCDAQPLSDSQIVNDKTVDKRIRKSKHCFIQPKPEIAWFFERAFTTIDRLNRDFYQFNLTGADYFQYTVYDGKKSKYDFHMDMILGERQNEMIPTHLIRKMSVVLFLQDQTEFEGGNFQMQTGGSEDSIFNIEQKAGTIILFPSYVLHRVTPVTKGIRKSIVFWILGPTFV